MRHIPRMVMALAILALLAACGAVAPTQPAGMPAMMEKPTEAAMMEKPTEAAMMEAPTEAAMSEKPGDAMMEAPTEAAMSEKPGDAMMEKPLWQTLILTNARSGETFTLGDFAGKTILVEPMATWCSKCREQMRNIVEARTRIDNDQVVFVGLSVETTISSAELARYVDEQGFDWTFAVMTPEMLQALADAFGRTITNPPSTPHFLIRPDGTVTELMTGIDTPDALVALVAGQ